MITTYQRKQMWLKSILPRKTRLTWKCKIMVHINPKVNLGFPSVMSSFRIFTSFTCHCGKENIHRIEINLYWKLLPGLTQKHVLFMFWPYSITNILANIFKCTKILGSGNYWLAEDPHGNVITPSRKTNKSGSCTSWSST